MMNVWWLQGVLLKSALILLFPVLAMAAIDVYQFDDPDHERRYRVLIDELGCPKCQHQSIGDSDADIAADMRAVTARMIREGHSNPEIIDYFRNRYGDFVHYRPPVRANTLILWLSPLVILLLGGLIIWRQIRRAASMPLEDPAETESAEDRENDQLKDTTVKSATGEENRP